MQRGEFVTNWTVHEGANTPQLRLDYALLGWTDTTGQQHPLPKAPNVLVIEAFAENAETVRMQSDLGELALWTEFVVPNPDSLEIGQSVSISIIEDTDSLITSAVSLNDAVAVVVKTSTGVLITGVSAGSTTVQVSIDNGAQVIDIVVTVNEV